MNKNELQQLAQKYLEGTASAEETQLLHQWYDTTTGEELLEIINTNAPETEEQIKQRIFNTIQARKALEDNIRPIGAKRELSVKRLVAQIAAVAAILLAVFMIWHGVNISQQQLAVADSQVVSVPANKVVKITLPDGSSVWLNAGSVFHYPKKFSAKTREVELVEGRAFFDVKHQTAHPFVVKTHNLNVTVLGTSFDVRSYKKEGTTKVSVVTGKVGITVPGAPDKPAIYLLPKQQIVLSSVSEQLIKQPTPDVVAVDAWCKNVQEFDQENLAIVFKAVEKKYHTKIIVEDKKLLNEHVTITLSDQRLDSIIKILSFIHPFNYKMANDSTIVIKK